MHINVSGRSVLLTNTIVIMRWQVSISKDDDSTQVNGELIPDDRFDGLETENSNKTTHQESSSSVAGNVNSLAGEDNQLPSIRVSPRVYGGDDDGDKDDIYNFEFSEDQKQAIQELCNLKLDLGFTAGFEFVHALLWFDFNANYNIHIQGGSEKVSCCTVIDISMARQ